MATSPISYTDFLANAEANIAQISGTKNKIISSADNLVSYPAKAILIVADTVLTSLTTGIYSEGSARLVGPTLPSGLYIMLDIASVQLTSGVVVLYA